MVEAYQNDVVHHFFLCKMRRIKKLPFLILVKTQDQNSGAVLHV